MPNWNDVLEEISAYQVANASTPNKAHRAVDVIRRKYLGQLRDHTGRNIIAYYSGFLSKPDISEAIINDEDKNGFMMAVHRLDRREGLDLILHTPGGSIAPAQSIVDYLHKMFGNDIRAIVPQIAMSAGTMIACSCSTIVMGKQSNLGPIDPQLAGVPAAGVLREFKKAVREIKRDPSRVYLWQSIIGKYHPTFLSQCENAIKWSNEFVREQLETVMFGGESDAHDKAVRIVRSLSDYVRNRDHSRHIHCEEAEALGLKIERMEDDQVFQDLVLTVHHAYMHSLMNTPAYKIIENHVGTAFVKQQAVQQTMVMLPQQPIPLPLPTN